MMVGWENGHKDDQSASSPEKQILILRNSEAMARAIIELLKDKEKALEMGRAGRRKAEESFSIEKNVKLTEEIYLNLLRRK